MFEIENDIPLPTHGQAARKFREMLSRMTIGQSVVVPRQWCGNMHATARRAGVSITISHIDWYSTRVWRVS